MIASVVLTRTGRKPHRMNSTKNKSTTCSIVIRCYNEEKHIGKLLHGISQQTLTDTEIIIVDSGSTDATVQIATRYPVKVITIEPEKFSFGRSLNLGCEAAQNEFIVICSAHVFPVFKDWLENILMPLQSRQIGLVYGKQQGGDETKFSEKRVFAHWFPEESNMDQQHPFCNNANAAIRKPLWRRYPYDEELTGLEDIDFAHRIMQAGFKVAYQARAPVVHVHNESSQMTYNRYRREAIALKRIFPKERFDLGEFIRLYFQNLLNDYLQVCKNSFRKKDLIEIPLFRFLQFWGTYRGFKESLHLSSQLKKTFYYPKFRNELLPADRPKTDHPLLIDYKSKGRTYREDH